MPRRLLPLLVALAVLASACGPADDQTATANEQAQAELPVLGHSPDPADVDAIEPDTERPAGSDAADREPATADASDEPAFGAIDGLPASIPIGTTYVATAIETEGVVPLWSEIGDGNDGAVTDPTWSLSAPTEFGGPRHFAVIDQLISTDGTGWLQVQVPVRPNGSVGWIRASDVTVAPVTTRMEIDLSDRSVIVWDGDEVVLDTTGAIGAERTPTPTGSFYIRDQFPWDPESVYGPWVFALSSYSEVIDQINGGDAVVAIHGTRNNSVLGDAVSLGCIRLDNDVLTQLASIVEPGTPVEVVP